MVLCSSLTQHHGLSDRDAARQGVEQSAKSSFYEMDATRMVGETYATVQVDAARLTVRPIFYYLFLE